MKVKIKRLSEKSVIPSYSKDGDAGMDLVATSKSYDDNGNVVYGTDLAFEIPKGYVGLLFPRSSNAKMDLLLSNSVGILDSGYRGEVMMKFKEKMNNNLSVFNTIVAIQQIAEMKEDSLEYRLNLTEAMRNRNRVSVAFENAVEYCELYLELIRE